MGRKKSNIHYIYKTSCNVTNRYYIGMHSTNNLDDGYMGSGKRLRYSIRKYGKDNHTKEILEFFDSRELLVEAEINAITPEMITDKDCMNLTEGGTGGHGARFLSKEQLSKGRKKCDDFLRKKYGDEFRTIVIKKYYDNLTDEDKSKRSENIKQGQKLINFNYSTFKNKTHSEKSKQKMSNSSKGMGKGKTNSQYGTCWITKDGENKKIKKEVLNIYISQGWEKGRKSKL